MDKCKAKTASPCPDFGGCKGERNRPKRNHRVIRALFYTIAVYFLIQLTQLFAIFLGADLETTWIDEIAWPDSTLNGEYSVGTIVWAPCPSMSDVPLPPGIDCGSVIVPKDYFNSSAGISSIAFARFNATNPRKGSVFLNPGGPGGSGMAMILGSRGLGRTLIGHNWDVIGFDPRGIGHTRPATQCFSSPEESALFDANTVIEQGITVSSIKNLTSSVLRTELVYQFRQFLALKKSQAEVCSEALGDELKYMGTANVVRDMDFMSEVFDGKGAKVNYFGGSYGSILGAYLVNMIPERIGYAVIDGIADPVNWATEPSHKWPANWVAHSEKTYNLFLEDCSQTGPELCPLTHFKGETRKNIEERLENFFDELAVAPLATPFSVRPGFLTSGAARGLLLVALERPRMWPQYARAFSEGIAGNGTALYNFIVQGRSGSVTRLAVTCIDSPPPKSLADFPTAEDLADEGLRTLEDVSIHFGLSTGLNEPDGGCQYWPVRGPERFTGPWNASLDIPLLIISNTYDPITPMTSGLRVNSLMPNSSVLVIQDGPGHCSSAMDSVCTAKVIRDYFNGVVPKNGTRCDVDNETFPDPEADWDASRLDAEDVKLVEAIREMHKALISARNF